MEKGSRQKMTHARRVKDGFDPELRKEAAKRRVAVIPVGSMEQHGAHLPVSTDSDLALEVSRRLCAKSGYLLFPPMEYGVSFEHAPLFEVSLRPATLRAVLCDVIASAADLGIRTVFVVNGHHGNQEALKGLKAAVRKSKGAGVKTFVFQYWKFMDAEFDHAGDTETSLMLAVSKNVRMGRAVRGFEGTSKADVQRAARMASKSFVSATGNGIWGDPTKATAAKGKKMLDSIVKNLEKECRVRLKAKTV